MTRTRMNKLVAMFLAILMTIALGTFVPKMKADAATSADFSISDNGISFICAREGFHSTCYSDYSQSSIGYGTKCMGSSVQPHASGSHTITKEAAMNALRTQVNSTYAPRVRTQTKGITMNQNQFDALVSLCYNCGGGNTMISNSPLVKYLKGELSESQARSNYSNYIVTAGGKKLPGLVNRRNAEADLFFSGCTIIKNNDDELGIPYPRPSGNPLLSTGSRGSGVSWLQTALNKANNAGLDVDGQFGSGTKQAVINFQKANGLEADGIAGPATVNKLVEVIKNKLNPPAPIVPQGHVMSESEAAGQTIPNGDYLIYSAIDQNYALDIPGDRISESGANIQMWKWANGVKPTVYDVFTVTYCGNGFYEIKQKNTDLCLDVYNGSLDMGTNVQLWSKNDTPSQQWSITTTEAGCMLQARCNGYCLDVSGGNVENGTNVQVYENNGTTSQRFIFSTQRLNLEFPNLSVDVNDEKVTFSWNLVDNATGYDLRIYYSNGTSYADYWDFSSNEHSLTITMPENTEFYAAVCSKNSNYDECWSYGQQVSFKTGIHKHEWGNWTIGKSATCKEAGIEIRNCKKCDENETRSISAIGHNWSSWSIVKEATCTSEGQEARTCTVCGAKETCSIAKTVHKFTVKVIAPTFTKQGYDLHTCSECGDFYKDNYTAIKIKGDINSDGEFNISDAVLLQKWILADPNAKLADWKAADLCEDGKIDVFDLCMMKRMLVAKS